MIPYKCLPVLYRSGIDTFYFGTILHPKNPRPDHVFGVSVNLTVSPFLSTVIFRGF
jgi:hypothetical protein